MIYYQVLANGIVLGGLYACIGVGFSLVWGVLNVINLLHGSFIVLGAYVAFFAYQLVGLHPFVMGQPFRLPALRQALTHCAQHPKRDRVWWTTPGAVADVCYALPAGTIPGEGP